MARLTLLTLKVTHIAAVYALLYVYPISTAVHIAPPMVLTPAGALLIPGDARPCGLRTLRNATQMHPTVLSVPEPVNPPHTAPLRFALVLGAELGLAHQLGLGPRTLGLLAEVPLAKLVAVRGPLLVAGLVRLAVVRAAVLDHGQVVARVAPPRAVVHGAPPVVVAEPRGVAPFAFAFNLGRARAGFARVLLAEGRVHVREPRFVAGCLGAAVGTAVRVCGVAAPSIASWVGAAVCGVSIDGSVVVLGGGPSCK